MKFDGEKRLILLEEKDDVLDVKKMYHEWKQWSANINNIAYSLAIRYVGGDNILNRKLGLTFFLINGWKIKPFSKDYTLDINGNLYSDDGKSPFVKADGEVNVLIVNTVSNLIDIIPLNVYNNSATTNISKNTNVESNDDSDDWALSQ